MKKSALRSKTIWLNVVTLAVAVLVSVQTTDPTIAEYMKLGTIVPILNILLRFISTGSISITGK